MNHLRCASKREHQSRQRARSDDDETATRMRRLLQLHFRVFSTACEVEAHQVTHILCRAWCETCTWRTEGCGRRTKARVAWKVVLYFSKPRIHLFACTHHSVSNSLVCNDWLAYKHQSTALCSNTVGLWFLVCEQAPVYNPCSNTFEW